MCNPRYVLASVLATVLTLGASSLALAEISELLPESPESDWVIDAAAGQNREFCATWDPDFAGRGGVCCNLPKYTGKSRGGRKRNPKRGKNDRSTSSVSGFRASYFGRGRCGTERRHSNYCGELDPWQKGYTEFMRSNPGADVFNQIESDSFWIGKQSYCSVNYGFLVHGRRLIPSTQNRIELRSPDRCTEFGTDPMIGMLEWTGRQIAHAYSEPEYQKVKLIVGDISAPRGGCLVGKGGRRGHASHTAGQDADIGFLDVRSNKASTVSFHRNFDTETNWWLIKQLFKNPYACIKVIFLDRRLISKVAKEARVDEDTTWPRWSDIQRYLRHVKGHRNHMHVRIGDGPGKPGCESDPDLETLEEDGEGSTE